MLLEGKKLFYSTHLPLTYPTANCKGAYSVAWLDPLSLSLSLSLSLYYQFKNPNRPRLPTTFSFVESDPLPMLSSEHSLGRSCIRSALSIIQSENSGDAAHSVIACRVESRVKSSHSFFVNFFRFRTLWKVE
jgi:hypothetical protein